MTIRSNLARNSLADVFNHIKTYAQPSCPFTFWTDKTSTGYCAACGSVPHTVRQVLGGVEGSILDAYGGEYEWDRWTVKLWANRGQMRDFSIRYGVNMLEYDEDYDSSGCYSSCRPYWTDGTTTVVGDKQTLGVLPPSGRDQCVPLDLSEKFESQPTKAQVESTAVATMNRTNPVIPSQNIEVSFVRLQDMGEYAEYQNLLQCKLCDTINVIFPDFNSSGQFKIVATEWNVLKGKYESMTLGDLSVSLSEALGINDIQRDSKSTIQQLEGRVNDIEDVVSVLGDFITVAGDASMTNVSASANTWATIGSIQLPAGTWVVTCRARFSATASGGKYSRIGFMSSSTGTDVHDSTYSASTNVNQHNATFVVRPSATTTYYLRGNPSVAGEWVRTAATAYRIDAVRIK